MLNEKQLVDYTYKFREIIVSTAQLKSYPQSQSIQTILEENQLDDRIVELKDTIISRIRELIDQYCTTHQQTIIKLYCEGYTTREIGKLLNRQKNVVHACLYGTGNTAVTYGRGGVIRKLRKLAKNDTMIQSCLLKIELIKKSN